jgi:hypothetical protein
MLLMTWQYYSHKDSNLRRDVTFHKLATCLQACGSTLETASFEGFYGAAYLTPNLE